MDLLKHHRIAIHHWEIIYSVEHWYVSVISIIFYCSMPILYNFHILLATFYTIFGTNILIQCPVLVPVCCMFYVSQKLHIKRSPNGIKTDGELFWNICDFWEEESTRDDARGGHEIGAHTHLKWARPLSRGHLGHRFALILPPENPKYSEIILRPFLSCLDSVWYWFSTKHKTCNRHELALGPGSIC